MSSAVISPSLAKALEAAGDEADSLNVFVKLSLPKHAGTPVERAAEAAKIVRRVEVQTHANPKFQYRDLDGVLQVKAGSDFLRVFVRQPEILEAKEVPGFTSALIEPVKKRDVDASEINTPFDSPRRTTRRGDR